MNILDHHFIKTLDTIVKDDTLLESWSGESIVYFI